MILDQFDLNGRVALVTGVSTGLGRAMAIGLAEAGADIAGVTLSGAADTGTVITALGRRFLEIRADLSSLEPIPRILTETVDRLGGVDILVNNAGIIRRRDALEFSEEDWDDVMNLNLKSLFFLSQAVGRRLVEQNRGGRIINIASMLSFQGGIRIPSYTASKSGVAGITRLLANEWARYGITVNAIAPGYMETDNTVALRTDEKRNAEILGRIPAAHWGKPEDLQGAVVFLASAASSYVTGHILAVDGGWLAR